MQSWLSTLPPKLSSKRDEIQQLFDLFVGPALRFVRKNCKEVIQGIVDSSLVKGLLNIYESLLFDDFQTIVEPNKNNTNSNTNNNNNSNNNGNDNDAGNNTNQDQQSNQLLQQESGNSSGSEMNTSSSNLSAALTTSVIASKLDPLQQVIALWYHLSLHLLLYLLFFLTYSFVSLFLFLQSIWLQSLFLFSVIWSLGASVDAVGRKKFDRFLRGLIDKEKQRQRQQESNENNNNNNNNELVEILSPFPEAGLIYDYTFDKFKVNISLPLSRVYFHLFGFNTCC